MHDKLEIVQHSHIDIHLAALFGSHTKKINKDKIEKVQGRAARFFRTILGVKQVSQKCYTI